MILWVLDLVPIHATVLDDTVINATVDDRSVVFGIGHLLLPNDMSRPKQNTTPEKVDEKN